LLTRRRAFRRLLGRPDNAFWAVFAASLDHQFVWGPRRARCCRGSRGRGWDKAGAADKAMASVSTLVISRELLSLFRCQKRVRNFRCASTLTSAMVRTAASRDHGRWCVGSIACWPAQS
jgi:hypothetical protein